ncbi:MAG: DUF1679 domain-containing protein [Lachnospiraceae bacterium]|nr:DUF1679 domain-containing protein [Lachnospiraceae bacterium]
MKRLFVIYDDSVKPNKEVGTITGHNSYGDTIFKRITLKNRMKAEIQKNKAVAHILFYSGIEDREQIYKAYKDLEEPINLVHLYSNFALKDTKEFSVLLTKAQYAKESFVAMCQEKTAMAIVSGGEEYFSHFEDLTSRSFEGEIITTDAFMDISKRSNFLTFITSGFDARFFNALLGDDYTVTKKSNKIEKIKSEYNFYYLLPDNMKMWFVMPFDYQEGKDFASYTMERYHMTDIAIRFVHGAVSTEELSDILEKLFYFLAIRGRKKASREEVRAVAKELYVDKLKSRMEELKKYPQYEQFDHMIAMGTEYESLEQVVETYCKLYEQVKRPEKDNNCLVIGHGDLCFSNILYSREADILKLIDPKGALQEEELYTDMYYDLAKLSHSICGCYDFFNSGLYEITMDRDMKLSLTIDADKQPYVEVFKGYLEKNDFDYRLVRLYEASLFLSMLPYHMDQPGKVFGFILNAINILDEVEGCIQE